VAWIHDAVGRSGGAVGAEERNGISRKKKEEDHRGETIKKGGIPGGRK